MKQTTLKIVIAAISIICFPALLSAQAVTEENYLKQDSILWSRYEQDIQSLWTEMQKYPDKKDSLRVVSENILEAASNKNRELAIEYASVPSGLRRLFMVRLQIPKDRLRSVFKALPEEVRASVYGKSILFHLNSKQIEVGDVYYDFEATTDEGAKFRLSSLAGKNILLLYGGLDCMGREGRDYLNSLYERTGRSDFEIIMYYADSDPERFKGLRAAYPCKFPVVSDLLHDSSPFKILYGAQARPTCFLIDKEGVVRMKTEGLDTDRVDELIKKQN